jgi:hypothetical protein
MVGALADDDSFYDEEFYYDAPLPKKVNMARIAMNISGLTPPAFAAKLQVSLTAIAADAATFTGATALLALGNQKHDALVDSDALVESLSAQLAQAREARRQAYEEAALFYEHDLVTYVKGIAKGDANIILAAGLDVAQPRGPSPTMTQVEGVVLSAGGNDGTGFVDWDPMFRARTYEVQLSSNPNEAAAWTTYDIVTSPGLELTGLPSGQKRWARVRAINNVNKGPWSDPSCCTIP